jgi:hypothetical protein
MACDCLREINEHLAKHNTRVCETFLPGILDPVVVVQFERISEAKGPMAIMAPIFCPFCAEPYQQGNRPRHVNGGAHVH